uniref:Large ribosomal subunit protein uL6 n=1 Tax=Desulfatirhabdium butyrativorans TaxID=340467 RepID=A0A7C4RRB7_9BACT
MSRIGKKPIPLPDRVHIVCEEDTVTVTGAKGTLKRKLHPSVQISVEDQAVHVRLRENCPGDHAFQGMTRALLANMVTGVSNGFERNLEIVGIGYRAAVSGKTLNLTLGYSHPVDFTLPDGVEATVEKNTVITLKGIDKELLGHTAAALKRLRPPEPYKGKGIRFSTDRIQKKAGKKGTK